MKNITLDPGVPRSIRPLHERPAPPRTIIFDHLDAAPNLERRHFWRCARAVRATPGWLVVRPDMEHPLRGDPAPVSGEIARAR